MKQIRIIVLFILLFTFFSKVNAQETMMNEISVPYLEKLIQTAKQNYPRHKIYTRQIGIAENNLNKIKLSWFDGLGIYYIYLPPSSAGGTIPPTSKNTSSPFQFGFSLNFGSLFQKPALINASKGERDVAILEKQEYELSIEADVKERYYKYIQQIILLKQRTQLSLEAQTMSNSLRSKFERGLETFDNLSKAQIFYNQQNQDKINTETEMLIAKAHLEELLNKKLEELK